MTFDCHTSHSKDHIKKKIQGMKKYITGDKEQMEGTLKFFRDQIAGPGMRETVQMLPLLRNQFSFLILLASLHLCCGLWFKNVSGMIHSIVSLSFLWKKKIESRCHDFSANNDIISCWPIITVVFSQAAFFQAANTQLIWVIQVELMQAVLIKDFCWPKGLLKGYGKYLALRYQGWNPE